MQIRPRLPINILVPAILLSAFAVGCATKRVSVSELSPGARVTVERVTAGGRVERIDGEVERGKLVYDVEATVGGKHMEYLIAAVDGAVLGTEVPIAFSELPQPVQAATEKYFGRTTELTVMKGDEYGETHYEVEGRKDWRTVEVTFDPAGNRTE